MRRKYSTRQIRLFLIGALTLIAGLAASVTVYLTAADDLGDVDGYVFVDGKAYASTLQDSKRYRHDLELFGGKAAVLADDFNRWLASLWHGKRLAILLAVLALGVALAFFRAALNQPPDRSGNGEG